MGKTSQPLRIVVLPPLTGERWVEEYAEKGHEIHGITSRPGEVIHEEILKEAHLILGPQCHFFHESWGKKELEEALKWTRRRVYPRGKGVKTDEEES